MAERPAGSNRGRPAIDWEEAFAYYVSLPDTARSYGAVAEHFGVSVRTVESRGRQGHWRERLAHIKAEAAQSADRRLAHERAAKLEEFALLIEATMTSYAQQLRAGSVKTSPSDLLRLYRLWQELWQELWAHSELTCSASDSDADPGEEDGDERRIELIRALDEAGAFERMRNLTKAHSPGSAENEADTGAEDVGAAA